MEHPKFIDIEVDWSLPLISRLKVDSERMLTVVWIVCTHVDVVVLCTTALE